MRIRGNAYQVLEKYLAMARDATAAGDRIAAENFYQHAEHYFRIVNANGDQQGANGRLRPNGPGNDEQEGDGQVADGDQQPPQEAEVSVRKPNGSSVPPGMGDQPDTDDNSQN